MINTSNEALLGAEMVPECIRRPTAEHAIRRVQHHFGRFVHFTA